MNAALQPIVPPVRPDPVLRTLVLCDLVDSTALVERLGDQRASELLRRHDRLARDAMERHHGREIDKTDGFLVLFERPIQAVAFALDYQRVLVDLNQTEGTGLQARVGIHLGEVMLWENERADVARGAKPLEVEGLVKPVAARLAALAMPGQVLLSGMTYGLLQRSEADLKKTFPKMAWQFHGRFSFKGVPEPVPVYEVGETSIAPLSRPPSSSKAWRHIPAMLRPKVIFAELLLAVVLVLGGLYFYSRTQPAIAFAERDWVVVGELRNLTGKPLLDDSIAVAFRVSLEQSRFVNLVPDLAVREALVRMKLDSNTANVDRSVGSQVALREGARALILPTITEVGGRVRVSAEIVDPNTETTVYAESADGRGSESALDSVDAVNRRLRNRLGEALSSIDKDSAPLPKVTTANLDALRAYALANRAYAVGQWRDAQRLFKQALDLDVEFDLARVGLARVHLGSDEDEAAVALLRQVDPARERLSPRDRLYFDALLASAEMRSAEAMERWKTLYQMYPDHFGAYANYALIAASHANRYDDALAVAMKAVSPHNTMLPATYETIAGLHLALGRYKEAEDALEQARATGSDGSRFVYFDVLSAQSEFEKADEHLKRHAGSTFPINEAFRKLHAVAMNLDRGHWQDALAIAASSKTAALALDPRTGQVFEGMELALVVAAGGGDKLGSRLRQFLQTQSESAGLTAPAARVHGIFNVAAIAYLAARAGEEKIAAEALAVLEPLVASDPRPNWLSLRAAARALLAGAGGDADTGLRLLAEAADGTELLQVHVARLQLLQQAGRHDDAVAEAQWLVSHRGRAYEEANGRQMLQALNVLDSNVAVLAAAESLAANGDLNDARAQFERFTTELPVAGRPAPVAARAEALQQRLAPKSEPLASP